MTTKTTLLKSLIACGCATAPILVNAQSIPPSCQRYVTALKVCGRDFIRYEGQMQPEQAPKLRSQLDENVGRFSSLFQRAVREKGFDETAKLCASPAASSQMIPAITNMMTVLSTGDAASQGCQDAYGRLVLPTLNQ